jgi:tuftelin-interacting protein 11
MFGFRYLFWKSSFSDSVLQLPGVAEGFARGLQLMNKASELSSSARKTLPKPNLKFDKKPLNSLPVLKAEPPQGGDDEEIPFRTIVEEFVAEHNLLFVPLNRAHQITRLPLFRVAQGIDGRGGVTVYILDDVVWGVPVGGSEEEIFKPIGLDDLVLRATKGKH